MYYVYVLIDAIGKKYVGYSSDLKRRIKEHSAKQVEATKNFTSLELFYYEAYQSEDLARDRERKLKQYGSAYKGLLKRIGL